MNKRGTLIVFLTSAIVGALLALAYFFFWNAKPGSGEVVRPIGVDPVERPDATSREKLPPRRLPDTLVEETSAQLMARYALNRVEEDPGAIAQAIGRLAQSADTKMLELMLERNLIPKEAEAALRDIFSKGGYKLKAENPVTEVGEIQRGKKVRWALNLEDGRRILVDMEKDDSGKWHASRIVLPSVGSNQANDPFTPESDDALGVIDAFMQATIAQRFDVAKRFVAPEKVADATIAGICILFEEGHYGLRKKQPLRNMFMQDRNAGYLAYVQSAGEGKAGNIGLTLEKNDKNAWIIADLALDSLLMDYANKFGGGDSLYIPLVKNPKGGDSLVLYFGFDEAVLTPRSIRQLEIVANILKLDANKKIEISGHTDDLGSDKYNQVLSEARAEAVRNALIQAGLAPDQVVTKGFGKKRQRRFVENTESSDAETIRRANRRAEIYLDF